MKALIIALAFIATIPISRCHVQTNSGRAYLVCPCKGVTYQCNDWYPIKVWQQR